MKGPLYSEVFKEAWTNLAPQKLLWFGLLAAFIGSASVFEFLIKAYYRLRLEYAPSTGVLVSVWSNILETGASQPGKAIAMAASLVVASAIIFFILLYFFVNAQGTLIAASAAFLKNKKSIDLREKWNTAREHFWPLLGVNLLRMFVLFGLLVSLTYPLITFVDPQQQVMKWGSALILIVVTLLVGTMISFIGLYAGNYVILHGDGFARSVEKAFSLFCKHWLVSCEAGLLMLLANIAALVIAVTASVLVMVPLAFLAVFFIVSGSTILLLPILLLTIFLFVVIAFVMAVYTTWVVSAWTSLFLHMDRGALLSRVLHWTRK